MNGTVSRKHDPLRGYLAESRRLAIDEIRRFVPVDSKLGPILYDLMLEYPLREAKGLRPALCIATCCAFGGSAEGALPSAAVIELYHNAFLIHDDVEDGSERRRDLPALHRQYGVPVAINVGDGMLALALEPLLENTRLLGLGKALRILQVISRMARETAEGQAIELDWVRTATWDGDDDAYRHMVVKKTGWYSFIAPVTIGAIVAGASEAQIAVVHEFAVELGIAFQIRDDILNLLADDQARYGKESRGDLWEGKHTLILMHLMRSASAVDRARAAAILARPRPRTRLEATLPSTLLDFLESDGDLTPQGRRRLEAALGQNRDRAASDPKTSEEVDYLFRRILAHGCIDYAREVSRRHAERARLVLESATPWMGPSTHRDLLHDLVEFTIRRDT